MNKVKAETLQLCAPLMNNAVPTLFKTVYQNESTYRFINMKITICLSWPYMLVPSLTTRSPKVLNEPSFAAAV